MTLTLPSGKRLAVNIGVDFDAQSLWIHQFGKATASALSRGEFGARVGLPRVLSILERNGIKGTFFTPTHTMMTFPAEFSSVVEAGHEVAAHGLYHESVPSLEPDEERRLLAEAIAQHEKHVGKRPRGYRSPSWEFSAATPGLLEEFGFEWDSSLMGRDFEAYRPQEVAVSQESGNTFDRYYDFIEYPVSWFLDDFPALEFIGGALQSFTDPDLVLRNWIAQFDFAHAHHPGGVLCVTVHPQCIGRGHNLRVLERFLEHVRCHDDVWVAPIGEIHQTYADQS